METSINLKNKNRPSAGNTGATYILDKYRKIRYLNEQIKYIILSEINQERNGKLC